MLVNTFLVNTVLQAALLFYGSKLCLHGPEGDGRNKMHPQVPHCCIIDKLFVHP